MKKAYKMLLISGFIGLAISGCKNKPVVDVDKTNPFFSPYSTPYNVPPFDKIMAKHYMPAFLKGMADGRQEIKNISNSKSTPTFENTIEAFDKSGEILSKVSFVFFSLATANTNDSLQNIEVEVSPLLSAYRDEILLDSALFLRVKSLYDSRGKLSFNSEQEFLLENLYKEDINFNKYKQQIIYFYFNIIIDDN